MRIILSALWGSLMLVYLLGDVLRIFAGDYKVGELAGVPASQWMWVAVAACMLTPIVMIVLSLVVPYPAIRWVCIVAAAVWIVFNLMGLPYPGAYDNFLIVVSLVVCGAIIWYAWQWTAVG
ncbi:MAG: hypothetical protein D9V44_05490 [Actinobacteria bacterium]|nr:MAG: hypothetical protein D9V44_05490 [Actinomycetota bacterium]